MAQALEEVRVQPSAGRRRPCPAAQPRRRGVAARRHAAVARRHGIGDRILQRRGLLQAGPRPHLRGHHLALHPGGAGRPGDGGRRVAPVRSARRGGRSVGADLVAGQHAVDGQCVLLRPDRRGTRAVATTGHRGRRDRRARVQRPRGCERSGRPRRDDDLRGGATADGRHDGAAARPVGPEPRPSRGAGGAGGDDHRCAHRLSRSRRPVGGAPGGEPRRGGGASGHGQDELRPGNREPRRGPRPGAGAAVLAGDEPPGADPADAVLGGGGRRHPDAQRAPARVGLAARSPTPSDGWGTHRSSSTTTRT